MTRGLPARSQAVSISVQRRPKSPNTWLRLPLADLEDEVAARFQERSGPADQPLDELEPGIPGQQGPPRLEIPDVGRQALPFRPRDVGRIGDDEIELDARAAEGREQVAPPELDVPDPVPLGVAARHREGPLGDVDGLDRGPGQLLGQGDRDAAAPRPDVEDGLGLARRELEDLFDQAFGLGPGHEHRRRHFDRDGPEFLSPGEMRERHAFEPPPDEAVEIGCRLRRAGPVRGGEIERLGNGGRPEEDHFGFEDGLGPVAQPGDPGAEELDEGRLSVQRPWPGRRRARSRRAPGPGTGGRGGPASRPAPLPGRPRCCGSSRSTGGR